MAARVSGGSGRCADRARQFNQIAVRVPYIKGGQLAGGTVSGHGAFLDGDIQCFKVARQLIDRQGADEAQIGTARRWVRGAWVGLERRAVQLDLVRLSRTIRRWASRSSVG